MNAKKIQKRVNKLSPVTQLIFKAVFPTAKKIAIEKNLDDDWVMQATWNGTRLAIEEQMFKHAIVNTDEPNSLIAAIPVSGIDDDMVQVFLDYAKMEPLEYTN